MKENTKKAGERRGGGGREGEQCEQGRGKKKKRGECRT